MKALNQLKTFQRILGDYPAETPLSKFLPGYFRLNKQKVSTDRKNASRLIYNYFRLGKALDNTPTEDRLIVAEFLCNTHTNSFLQHFKPEWALCVGLDLNEKLKLVKTAYPANKKTEQNPKTNELSDGIDKKAFLESFFVQPDLFI